MRWPHDACRVGAAGGVSRVWDTPALLSPARRGAESSPAIMPTATRSTPGCQAGARQVPRRRDASQQAVCV